MSFCHLHIHNTIGSPLDGIGKIEDYADKAVEYNHKSLACTDHGSLAAIYNNQIECLKKGIKPIIGIEAYINNELVFLNEKDKRVRTKNSHLTILVKDKIGYKNLCNLSYLSNKDTDHFYYAPRVTEEEVIEHKEGLIIGSGCMMNPIAMLLRNNKYNEAVDNFERYALEFGDNFYVEIHLNELTNKLDELDRGQKDINDFFIDMSNRKGIPIIMAGDVHFLNKGDDKLQNMSFAIRDKTSLDKSFELEAKNLYYHNENDYLSFNKDFNYHYREEDILSWCNNASFIADKCNYIIPKNNKINTPILTSDDDRALIIKAKKGLVNRLRVDRYEDCPDEYIKRLESELKVIIEKGFSSYFLVVADISDFSIKNDIPGRWGRGSVAGSLTAWSLRISQPDPIKFNLLFQRFLNEERCSSVGLSYFKDDDDE